MIETYVITGIALSLLWLLFNQHHDHGHYAMKMYVPYRYVNPNIEIVLVPINLRLVT